MAAKAKKANVDLPTFYDNHPTLDSNKPKRPTSNNEVQNNMMYYPGMSSKPKTSNARKPLKPLDSMEIADESRDKVNEYPLSVPLFKQTPLTLSIPDPEVRKPRLDPLKEPVY